MTEPLPDTPFQRWLEQHGACWDARVWVGRKSPATSWRTATCAPWMRFLLLLLADDNIVDGERYDTARAITNRCLSGCHQPFGSVEHPACAEAIRHAIPTLPPFLRRRPRRSLEGEGARS